MNYLVSLYLKQVMNEGLSEYSFAYFSDLDMVCELLKSKTRMKHIFLQQIKRSGMISNS